MDIHARMQAASEPACIRGVMMLNVLSSEPTV
jgi:hypothetical protein